MKRSPWDTDDAGDHAVASHESQSDDLHDDALQSFNPFNDVFSDSSFSHSSEQVLTALNSNDSRPEDAWTDNARRRSISSYLQNSGPGEDPSWLEAFMRPDSVGAEESPRVSIPNNVHATAIQSLLDQLQEGSVTTMVSKTFDRNGRYADSPEGDFQRRRVLHDDQICLRRLRKTTQRS